MADAPITPRLAWLAAARPKTLTASIVPVAAGSALGYAETGRHLWWITICALLSTICIQIGTNFINDAIDYKNGADTEARLGPPRMTQMGIISPDAMMKGAALVFLLSVIFGLFLVLHGGLPILVIGLLSVLFGYGYTSGPYPLAYNGLGELFVIIFFGIVAVGGIFFLQTGTYSTAALILGVQIGLLATLIIEVNNYRDIHNDTAACKRTLAVRIGAQRYLSLIELTAILPFLLVAYWVRNSAPMSVLCIPLLFLAHHIVDGLKKNYPSRECNRFLEKAALLHLAFGISIIFTLTL